MDVSLWAESCPWGRAPAQRRGHPSEASEVDEDRAHPGKAIAAVSYGGAAPQRDAKPRLSVIGSSAAIDHPPEGGRRGRGRPHPELRYTPSLTRPGDHHQLVLVPASPALGRFAAAAAAAGLVLHQGLALCVERRLLLDDVAAAGFDPTWAVEALDAAATGAVARLPLSAAVANYVRALAAPPARSSELGTGPLRIMLPIRLVDRARQMGITRALEPEAIEAAMAWERAAALQGQTMSAWGLLELLDRSAPRAADNIR